MFGPGQRVDADGAQGERPVARVKDLTNLDLHLCVGSFVVSGQHTGLDNCVKRVHGVRSLKSASSTQASGKESPTVIVFSFAEFRCTSQLFLLAAALSCAQTFVLDRTLMLQLSRTSR